MGTSDQRQSPIVDVLVGSYRSARVCRSVLGSSTRMYDYLAIAITQAAYSVFVHDSLDNRSDSLSTNATLIRREVQAPNVQEGGAWHSGQCLGSPALRASAFCGGPVAGIPELAHTWNLSEEGQATAPPLYRLGVFSNRESSR